MTATRLAILSPMFKGGRNFLASTSVLMFLAAPAFADTAFPTDGLQDRIEFWKSVFTRYGADDIVVHDRFHVNLIYAVAADNTVDARIRAVKQALSEIREKLGAPTELSEIREKLGSPMELSDEASLVYQALIDQGLVPSASLLDELIDGVHTQRGVKERFRAGIIRSGRYLDSFRTIMQEQDVPAEIALLPLVESSYENARSSAAAVGVWQFTRSTGRQYLRVSGRVDERLDPVKSAKAAAKLLRENYDKLGNWPLALTAYNHGRGGMLRAQAEHGSDLTTIISDYRGPVFGYASMNFYTEFLAAIEVYENHEQYFGTLTVDQPLSQPTAKPVLVQAQAPTPRTVTAKTPAPRAATAKTPTVAAKTKTSSYTVRRGDTLTEIARQFRTSTQRLIANNGLAGHTIYAGQILLIP